MMTRKLRKLLKMWRKKMLYGLLKSFPFQFPFLEPLLVPEEKSTRPLIRC